jgi:hypothetical protein
MLSLKRCREILGADSPETESDLELLRDQLYGLARVAVEACPTQRRRNSQRNAPDGARQAIKTASRNNEPKESVRFSEALASLSEEERYEVEERAGIMEFDGGLDRSAAEQAAFSEFWRAKHRGPSQK